MKFRINNFGYMRVNLCYNAKRTTVFVHRLVAIHFIDNPDNKFEVNHKDRDRINCRKDNLEWMTHVENMYYQWNKELSIEYNDPDENMENPFERQYKFF